MTNTPATVEAPNAIAQVLNKWKPVIAKLLANTGVSDETFVAQLANACRVNPDLWGCDPETVLGAGLRCAQLGLAPNDGTNLAYIIPYKRVATFQLGYGGVMELARRASPGLIFDGAAVYPGDLFKYDMGAERPLSYTPAAARSPRKKRTGEAYAWWARARYADGREHVHMLDRDGVEYHRSFSRQPDGLLWTKSYDAAALKSVVIDMRRWLPASATLALATAADGAVVDVRRINPDAPELPPPPLAPDVSIDPDQGEPDTEMEEQDQ